MILRLFFSILFFITGLISPFTNFGEYSFLSLLSTSLICFVFSYALLPNEHRIVVNKLALYLFSQRANFSNLIHRNQHNITPSDSPNQDPDYLNFLLVRELEKIDNMDGLTFETYCAELLSSIGYSNVSVTKSSGDQGIDVTAKFGNTTYGFQCKNYSKPVGNSSVQEAHAGRAFYNLDKTIVFTNNYFTSSAKSIASETNVELWDRDILTELIIDSFS